MGESQVDPNAPAKEYAALEAELQAFYHKLNAYRAKFGKRTNVLRDRGTLNDATLQEHLNVELFIDLLNRVEKLESLTAVLRSEE